MDFKTTVLPKKIEVSEELIPEIFGLYFGITPTGVSVFDYTEYIERNKLTPIDYKVFMRTNSYMIGNLARLSERETSQLFFQNADGHILIANELVMLCIEFVNPDMLIYFNNLLAEVLTEGVAYSNAFIYDCAVNRMPTEALEQIIKDRRENETA